MAPRKNAKGSGGNSSSSGSSSGSQGSGSSGGSSSSPGTRRDTKHGGHKNGRKGGLSGSSFFTWFMVLALLGVWTSVAVVWFDLVDYEEVLGKLGVYDADGDGDFDVDDAKVLLGLKERAASAPAVQEEAEPHPWMEEHVPENREPQNIEDEVQEQIESLLHETVHTEHAEHEAEDSYVEDPAAQDYNQDIEEMMYEQENTDSTEPVIDDGKMYYDADDVTYQDYEEQVYEPENEGREHSDTAVEDSNIVSEDVPVSHVEEQEVPPDT